MTPFMRDIATWLEGQGLHSLRQEDERLFGGPFRANHGEWRLYVWLPDRDRVVFFSVLIPLVPPTLRPAMADLMNRLNRRLIDASFDLDMETGEMRCRSVAAPLGYEPYDPFLEAALMANVVATDRFIPAIEDVLFSRRSPAEAVQAAALAPDNDQG